jgi:hypothetical protein
MLRVQKRHQGAAESRSFVSTLCVENEEESCKRGARLCAFSAQQLTDGHYSAAETMGVEARRVGPKSYALRGS